MDDCPVCGEEIGSNESCEVCEGYAFTGEYRGIPYESKFVSLSGMLANPVGPAPKLLDDPEDDDLSDVHPLDQDDVHWKPL